MKLLIIICKSHFIICFLESYLISAGTNVTYNIYAVHRDPNFWTNPEIFDPDRFLPMKIQNHYSYLYSYIPFSAEPRNCIGKLYYFIHLYINRL